VPEYVPVSQGVHVDAPVVLEYVPVIHDWQMNAPVAIEYVPAIHDWQMDAPVVLEYVPAIHDWQEDAPVAEYVPVTQGVHMDAPAIEYVPAIHDWQMDAPVVLEYVPAIHDWQEDAPVAEYVPVTQGVHVDAPAIEYVPVPQDVHAAVPPTPNPSISLNVPAAQALHTTPSETAQNPTRHMQLFSCILPLAAPVLVGHVIHVWLSVPITTPLYVSTGHERGIVGREYVPRMTQLWNCKRSDGPYTLFTTKAY
jgi:hypothetical protein